MLHEHSERELPSNHREACLWSHYKICKIECGLDLKQHMLSSEMLVGIRHMILGLFLVIAQSVLQWSSSYTSQSMVCNKSEYV
jgi:hypothetical protein